jgi:hypothetical protein
MAGSSERINYNLRPAKHVERKMMCEAFRRLSAFGSVDSYRYVGFGSFYFRDFALIHRALGISNMLSIEREEENRERFQFNVPYRCIEIAFGESSEILPTLKWDVRTILWLDYDYGLDTSILGDLTHFCANACAGSVLVVSMNAHSQQDEETPTNKLKEKVGETNVPPDVTDANLRGWAKARTYRRIVLNSIAEALNIRNGTRAPGSTFDFKQLFNFHYSDNAKMLTVGGLLYEEGHAHIVASCDFASLPFIRTDEEEYKIEIPRLTYKEIRSLDEQLPSQQLVNLRRNGIPVADLENYSRLYRYFPTFVEADLF